MTQRTVALSGALGAAALALWGCGPKPISAEQACQTAIYRLSDGRLLDITPSDGEDLRWRLDDGRTGRLSAKANWSSTLGWTRTPDGVTVKLGPCGARQVTFVDKGAQPVTGDRVALEARDVTFRSGDVDLHGRLVMPPGSDPVPVLVEVHGSEKTAATTYYYDQRTEPAQGVGVFVYDKRGTGQSTGKYTQDFQVLARDAAAAVAEARSLAGKRLSRIGIEGGSQGGWIAPLAATLTPVDFLIVDYGLAGSPGEENTDQTVLELRRKGYGEKDLAEAAEVAEAANAVIASHSRSGFERLEAVETKYRSRPWYKQLNGQFTGQVVKYPIWLGRIVGPLLDTGTPIDYDPMPVLRSLRTPMLWILADEDTLAPNATTRQRLLQLKAQGAPITIWAFPDTDHGILEYVTAPDGTRTNTRYAEGYFRAEHDWALTGRLNPPYGRGYEVLAAPSATATNGKP